MTLVLVHPFGKHLLRHLQLFGVEPHAVYLHVGENLHQWHLNVLEKPSGVYLVELFLQHVSELKRDVSVLGRVLVHLLRFEVAHVFLVLALWPYQLFNAHCLIAEQCLRHVVHVVAQFRLPYIVGEHRVEHLALNVHAIVAQHLIVVFYVLANLQAVGVLVERLEYVYHLLRLIPHGRNGHVVSLVFLYGEAQPHQFSVYRVGRVCLRVEAYEWAFHQFAAQQPCLFLGAYQLIVVLNGVDAGELRRDNRAFVIALLRRRIVDRLRICVVARNGAITEKVGLLRNLYFLLAKKSLGEALELKVAEYFAKLVGVRLRHFKLVEVKLYWHVGPDGGEKLRHLDVFLRVLHLFP